MNPSSKRSVRAGRIRPLGRALLASLVLAACAAGPWPAIAAETAPTPATAPPAPGAWQKHEYSFAFMGFTTIYSCDGLADKLKTLLLAAGARPDAKARAGACAGFGRPDKFARADLTFYTLTPAGGDSVPADRAGGDPAADAAGRWTPVTWGVSTPRDLARGDCELVDQFRAQVLPMFSTRNLENHTTCIPHQLSGSTVALSFESFSAPPAGADHKRPTPRRD